MVASKRVAIDSDPTSLVSRHLGVTYLPRLDLLPPASPAHLPIGFALACCIFCRSESARGAQGRRMDGWMDGWTWRKWWPGSSFFKSFVHYKINRFGMRWFGTCANDLGGPNCNQGPAPWLVIVGTVSRRCRVPWVVRPCWLLVDAALPARKRSLGLRRVRGCNTVISRGSLDVKHHVSMDRWCYGGGFPFLIFLDVFTPSGS